MWTTSDYLRFCDRWWAKGRVIGPYLHVVDRQSIRREQLVREYIHHKRRTIPDGWRTRRGAGTGRRARQAGESRGRKRAGSAISRIPPLPRRCSEHPPAYKHYRLHAVTTRSMALSRPRLRVSGEFASATGEKNLPSRGHVYSPSLAVPCGKRRPTSVGTPRASLPPSRLFRPLRALRFPRESARFLRDREPRQGRRISVDPQ